MQANLTSKGQVTIPKAMRDHLGLAAGAPVRFAYTESGGVAILPAHANRAKPATAKAAPSRFDKLKGSNIKGWAATGLKSTDEIMRWLRGYGDDGRDPGFTDAVPVRRTAAIPAKRTATRAVKHATKHAAKRKK